MSLRRFDLSYRESIRLGDQEVLFRLLRADDAEALREGFAGLSAETRHKRFFTGKLELSERELEYLTDLDNENHLAIAAAIPGPNGEENGIAVARFVRFTEEPSKADVAVTVTDEAQNQGVGRALCERIIAAAKERAIERLHFEVLASNVPMLSLLRDIAPGLEERKVGGSVIAEMTLS